GALSDPAPVGPPAARRNCGGFSKSTSTSRGPNAERKVIGRMSATKATYQKADMRPRQLDIRQASGQLCFQRDCGRFLVVASDVHPSESKPPLHGHDFAYFSFVLRGTTFETFDTRQERWNKPWTSYFHPRDEVHAAQIITRARILAVRLTKAFQEDVDDRQ